jgi:hypothetical protein
MAGMGNVSVGARSLLSIRRIRRGDNFFYQTREKLRPKTGQPSENTRFTYNYFHFHSGKKSSIRPKPPFWAERRMGTSPPNAAGVFGKLGPSIQTIEFHIKYFN